MNNLSYPEFRTNIEKLQRVPGKRLFLVLAQQDFFEGLVLLVEQPRIETGTRHILVIISIKNDIDMKKEKIPAYLFEKFASFLAEFPQSNGLSSSSSQRELITLST